ncbi:MAG: hypothetical protein JST76_13530 [Bacteroidetes bacterium]|nr:hypothetical protein [Bacteroidota bacterium]
MRLDDKYCCYCGYLLGNLKETTKEHIIPQSKGGNNKYINKVHCCKSCNGLRDNLSFESFYSKVETMMNEAKVRNDMGEYYNCEGMLENIKYVKEYADKMGDELKYKTRPS